MYINAEILIPDMESNYGIQVCGALPKENAKKLQEGIGFNEGAYMAIDNLAHGCGATCIKFHIDGDMAWEQNLSEDTLLQLTVNKDTLHKMIQLLQIAHDNFIE